MAETNTNQTDQQSNSQTPTNPPAQPAPEIDYEKLAGVVEGRQRAAGESALKNYLKQQGLTSEQMEDAIRTYKEQQAANTPDVDGLQTQLTQAQTAARQAQLESAATLEAVALGIDPKTIPYLIRLADISQAVSADGKVDNDAVKNALNQVLEDVPALKPQARQSAGIRIGVSSGTNNSNQSNDDALKAAFGL
ncbi:MAG: hypothetical protein Q4F79_05610 [Eubacteriales bacterium]|nr:hypothetical protein [Eubacteriales bacterium]